MVLQKKRMMVVGLLMASTCLADPTATTTAAKTEDQKTTTSPTKAAGTDAKAEKPEVKPLTQTDKEKASYGIGTRIAGSLKSQNIPVELKSLVAGIEDTLAGTKPKYTEKEIEEAMTALQGNLEKNMADAAKKNKEDGEKFLAKNKSNSKVKTTKSGLQYKVITEGKGDAPKDESKVKVHYRGTLIDGKEFDSSYKRNAPAEFTVNGVIPGWSEALKLMKPGAKWELVIPSELAYGARGTPGIPPNSVLSFTVELLEVMK